MSTPFDPATLRTLVAARDVHAHLDRLLVLDCRFDLADTAAGARRFAAGHIPGAQYVHLDDDLSGPIIPGVSGRHPLPERTRFAARVGGLGVTPDTPVVAVDDAGGAIAARAWWLLRWLGHARVAVLDGGIPAWQAAGLDLTTRVDPPRPAPPYPARAPLTRQVDVTDLPAAGLAVLDARAAERFRGEVEPIDAVAGHIPGARCAPFQDNLVAGRFKPAAELATRFRALQGSAPDVICYCGSGVTAAHNILACVHAGLDEPALYPGSWSEWIADRERPVATGD